MRARSHGARDGRNVAPTPQQAMPRPRLLLAAALVACAPAGAAAKLRRSRLAPQAERASSGAGGGYRQVLHNFQDVQYFADFQIGGQNISGIFDTGSFELLVRSSRCLECVHPTPPYERAGSTTYQKNGTVIKHVFGSGPCISMLGYEDVSVGPGLRSERQAFWEILQHRIMVLDTAKFAAIVGIGPNFAYGHLEKTLLMSLGVEEFSICLQKPSGSEGFLTWGQEKHAPPRQDLLVAKVIGQHHWATTLSNVSFRQTPSGSIDIPCGGSGCVAIMDSGTSLIAAPGIALLQLGAQIPRILEDCSNLHKLPTLRFTIGGHALELPPEAYVMRITGATLDADSIWDLLFFKPKIRRVDVCIPAFMQMDMMSIQGPVWIFGMPFFRYYHTTFDRADKAMRFARAGPGCEPLPFTKGTNGSLLSVDHRVAGRPMDVEVGALIPPRLSGMMDFPFTQNGLFTI